MNNVFALVFVFFLRPRAFAIFQEKGGGKKGVSGRDKLTVVVLSYVGLAYV